MSGVWLALFVVLWVVVVAITIVVIGVLKQVTSLLADRPVETTDFLSRSLQVSATYGGVPPGTKLADFTVFDSEGREVSSTWLHREPRLYLFVAGGCAPCDQLLDQVRALEASPAPVDLLTVIVHDFEDGKLHDLPAWIEIYRQEEQAVSEAFAGRSFPQAFVVDEGGTVLATTIPTSVDDMARMYEQAIGGGMQDELSAARNGRNELRVEVPTT
jgi:thiol-disulfide isomerase/thioredoxin